MKSFSIIICAFVFTLTFNFLKSQGFTEIPTGIFLNRIDEMNWVDFDNDNDLDIYIAGVDSLNNPMSQILVNNSGIFSNFQTSLPRMYFCKAAWGDFNNDYFLDFIIMGQDSNAQRTQVFTGSSVGFVSTNHSITNLGDGGLGFLDFDNDGDLDLTIAGSDFNGSNLSEVYLNESASFSLLTDTLAGGALGTISNFDFDIDGDLDILSSGMNTSFVPQTTIYQNSNGNTLSIFSSNIPDIDRLSVSYGDIDNDGDLDLIYQGYANANPVSDVLVNNGGVFAPMNAGVLGLNNGTVMFADLDNDGDLEFFTCGADQNNAPFSKIYANNAGVFADAMVLIANVTQGGGKFGDYDNDGDLDLLIFGRDNGTNVTKLYRNDFTTTPNTPPTPPTINPLFTLNPDSSITISWSGAADAETPTPGLSYSLWIGTSEHGLEITSPPADTATGYRRLVEYGQVKTTSWTLKNVSCANDYWFRVQAVDGGYMGSEFSAPLHVSFANTITANNQVGNLVTLNITGDYDSIQWYDSAGVAIAGATGLQHTLLYSGTYTITVFNGFCSSTLLDTTLTMVGLKDAVTISTVKVWPNPTNSEIKVRVDNPGATSSIEIFDMQGRLMRRMDAGFTTETAMPVTDLSSGLYMIKLSLKNGRGIQTATFRKD